MASPQLQLFFVLSAVTNLPLTGAAGGMSFELYRKYNGSSFTDLTPPTIIEVGDGLYAFAPTFADLTAGISYVINTGSGNPQRVFGYMRPEDWNADLITTLVNIETGKWEIKTSGPDANKLIIYAQDGVTPLYKFQLFDSSGTPTSTNPFKRVPS